MYIHVGRPIINLPFGHIWTWFIVCTTHLWWFRGFFIVGLSFTLIYHIHSFPMVSQPLNCTHQDSIKNPFFTAAGSLWPGALRCLVAARLHRKLLPFAGHRPHGGAAGGGGDGGHWAAGRRDAAAEGRSAGDGRARRGPLRVWNGWVYGIPIKQPYFHGDRKIYIYICL